MDYSKINEDLFEYLRCILFEDNYEDLDPNSYPEEYAKLCQGLVMLSVWMKEYKTFSGDLSLGNLDSIAPDMENPIVWPIKAFRSNLLRLTWQAQQISKGDYSQRISYSKDFSDAFNQITSQLSQYNHQVNSQMRSSEQRERALLRSHHLMVEMSKYMGEMVIVYDLDSKRIVFENKVAQNFNISNNSEALELYDKIISHQVNNVIQSEDGGENGTGHFEIQITDKNVSSKTMVFDISCYPVEWKKHNACACIIKDLSSEKNGINNMMEKLIIIDPLTGLYNKNHYLQTLEQWLKSKSIFCVCFLDLEGLREVNDSLGYSEGDKYIRNIAELIKHSFRHDDMQFHTGGDQFIILMSNVNQVKAKERMDDLNQKFLMSSTSKYKQSANYGIIEVNTGDAKMTVDKILELVDRQMYEDKNSKYNIETKKA